MVVPAQTSHSAASVRQILQELHLPTLRWIRPDLSRQVVIVPCPAKHNETASLTGDTDAEAKALIERLNETGASLTGRLAERLKPQFIALHSKTGSGTLKEVLKHTLEEIGSTVTAEAALQTPFYKVLPTAQQIVGLEASMMGSTFITLVKLSELHEVVESGALAPSRGERNVPIRLDMSDPVKARAVRLLRELRLTYPILPDINSQRDLLGSKQEMSGGLAPSPDSAKNNVIEISANAVLRIEQVVRDLYHEHVCRNRIANSAQLIRQRLNEDNVAIAFVPPEHGVHRRDDARAGRGSATLGEALQIRSVGSVTVDPAYFDVDFGRSHPRLGH